MEVSDILNGCKYIDRNSFFLKVKAGRRTRAHSLTLVKEQNIFFEKQFPPEDNK